MRIKENYSRVDNLRMYYTDWAADQMRTDVRFVYEQDNSSMLHKLTAIHLRTGFKATVISTNPPDINEFLEVIVQVEKHIKKLTLLGDKNV